MNWLIASMVLAYGLLVTVIGRLCSAGWFNIFMAFLFGAAWIAALSLYFRDEIWAWFDNRFL